MDTLQLIFLLNVFFAVVVFFYIRQMLKAGSLYKWNPGDAEMQSKQKIIILQSIVVIACIALFAAILNAFFGLAT